MTKCFNCARRIGIISRLIRLFLGMEQKYSKANLFKDKKYLFEVYFCSDKCASNYLDENDVWTNHPFKLGLINYHREKLVSQSVPEGEGK